MPNFYKGRIYLGLLFGFIMLVFGSFFYIFTADTPETNKKAVYANQETTTAQTTEKTELDVYITQTGDKYHLKTCQYIKNGSHNIKMTEAEAIKQGYTPCSICLGED